MTRLMNIQLDTVNSLQFLNVFSGIGKTSNFCSLCLPHNLTYSVPDDPLKRQGILFRNMELHLLCIMNPTHLGF